jgi:GDPmannose 4,6-dehydratase
MTALIFGANGQDGYYLAERCRARGMRVIGVSRSSGDRLADVGCYEDVAALVRELEPALIFHLSANSTTSHSTGLENHHTIATGGLNVLEAAHRHCKSAKVFITGSGVQFENRGFPIRETDPFVASSLYAVSRIQAVYAARYYRSLGLRAYVGYLLHHESPLRKAHHVSQKIVSAVRRIAAGSSEVLELGDVSVRKEWTFAGDVAAGILQLMDQENIFEAMVGSGDAYSIEDWLVECFGLVVRDWKNHVRIKPGFVAEYKVLVCDPGTMKSLGWAAATGFSELARQMMNQT